MVLKLICLWANTWKKRKCKMWHILYVNSCTAGTLSQTWLFYTRTTPKYYNIIQNWTVSQIHHKASCNFRAVISFKLRFYPETLIIPFTIYILSTTVKYLKKVNVPTLSSSSSGGILRYSHLVPLLTDRPYSTHWWST
jgi:hypothetical protein